MVRWDAAELLIEAGTREPLAIDFFMGSFKQLGHPSDRAAAAAVLVKVKEYEKAATDVMLEIVNSNAAYREYVLSMLSAFPIEQEKRIAILTNALQHQDSFRRQVAVAELGRLGPAAESAVPALCKLQNDKDRFVRWQVAGALRAIEK